MTKLPKKSIARLLYDERYYHVQPKACIVGVDYRGAWWQRMLRCVGLPSGERIVRQFPLRLVCVCRQNQPDSITYDFTGKSEYFIDQLCLHVEFGDGLGTARERLKGSFMEKGNTIKINFTLTAD